MPSLPGSSSSLENAAPGNSDARKPALTDCQPDDQQETDGNYARLGPRQSRWRTILRAIVIVVTLVGAALCVFLYARHYELYPHTDNAYVQADVVRIAPRVSGPVVELPIRDNQWVRRGDLLIQIDPEDYRVRLQQAQAQLAVTDAQIDQAKASIEQAQAAVEENDQRVHQAQAQADRSRRDFDRANALMHTAAKAISQQDLDAARQAMDSANANLDAAKAQAHAARAQEQAAEANHKAALAQRSVGQATVRSAELDLSYTRILAPVDGWVTNLNLPPGNYLATGQTPLAMVADHTFRVLAYYKETVTAQMRPGQRVSVRLFPYPDKVFDGVVEGLGWGIYQADGTANAATLQLPEVSPTINWVRLPQRFPVRISLPHEDPVRPFRVGQTAIVEIDTVSGTVDTPLQGPRQTLTMR